jgi:hypothetical protein
MSRPTAGGRVRLRPHDAFDLIRLLARSQSDPRKAVAELVQNSLDAGARRVDMTWFTDKGRRCLRVLDDGEGVFPGRERQEALRTLAQTIGRSHKRSLEPAERHRLLLLGQYGIGLLGFWSARWPWPPAAQSCSTTLPAFTATIRRAFRGVARDLPELELFEIRSAGAAPRLGAAETLRDGAAAEEATPELAPAAEDGEPAEEEPGAERDGLLFPPGPRVESPSRPDLAAGCRVQVDPDLAGRDRASGIPEPERVEAPAELWRSRMLGERWQVQRRPPRLPHRRRHRVRPPALPDPPLRERARAAQLRPPGRRGGARALGADPRAVEPPRRWRAATGAVGGVRGMKKVRKAQRPQFDLKRALN